MVSDSGDSVALLAGVSGGLVQPDSVNAIISNTALGALLLFFVALYIKERRQAEAVVQAAQESEREAWRKRVEDAQRHIAELRALHEAAQTRADAVAATHLEVVRENTAASTALTATLDELRRDLRRRPSEPGGVS